MVDRAYDGAGSVHAFFREVFGRDSIDGHGKHLISSVHYGDRFANAAWDRAQMIYGNGAADATVRDTSRPAHVTGRHLPRNASG